MGSDLGAAGVVLGILLFNENVVGYSRLANCYVSPLFMQEAIYFPNRASRSRSAFRQRHTSLR